MHPHAEPRRGGRQAHPLFALSQLGLGPLPDPALHEQRCDQRRLREQQRENEDDLPSVRFPQRGLAVLENGTGRKRRLVNAEAAQRASVEEVDVRDGGGHGDR